jgi:hypothetical protein
MSLMREITPHHISKKCLDLLIEKEISLKCINLMREIYPLALKEASSKFNKSDRTFTRKRAQGQWQAELVRAEVLDLLRPFGFIEGKDRNEKDCLVQIIKPEVPVCDSFGKLETSSNFSIEEIKLIIKTSRTNYWGKDLTKKNSEMARNFQNNACALLSLEKQLPLFSNIQNKTDSSTFGEKCRIIISLYLGCNGSRLDEKTTHSIIIPKGHRQIPFFQVEDILIPQNAEHEKVLYLEKLINHEKESKISLFEKIEKTREISSFEISNENESNKGNNSSEGKENEESFGNNTK